MTLTGMWTEFHQKRLSETEEDTHTHTNTHTHTHMHYRDGGKLQMDEIATFIMVLSPRASFLVPPRTLHAWRSFTQGGCLSPYRSRVGRNLHIICEDLRTPQASQWGRGRGRVRVRGDCRAVRQRTKHSVAQGSHDAALARPSQAVCHCRRVHLATSEDTPPPPPPLRRCWRPFHLDTIVNSVRIVYFRGTELPWGLAAASEMGSALKEGALQSGGSAIRTTLDAAGSSTESQKKQRHSKKAKKKKREK